MCVQAIGEVDRPKHLPIEAMDKLAEPLSMARAVQLHGIGEPLVSPSFWRILEEKYLKAGTDVNINTNLTILDEKRIRRLTEFPGQLALNVSLDAATAQTYKRIRGFDFDQTISNFRNLMSARGDRKSPLLYMNMTLMHENIREAALFVELAHSLRADGVYLWHLNRWDAATMEKYKLSREGWSFNYDAQGL